jgi:hypothetical protein
MFESLCSRIIPLRMIRAIRYCFWIHDQSRVTQRLPFSLSDFQRRSDLTPCRHQHDSGRPQAPSLARFNLNRSGILRLPPHSQTAREKNREGSNELDSDEFSPS